MQTRKNEIWVGVFLLLALLAALFICLRAADITSIRTEPTIASMPPSITSAA
jgi:phospholipid/cholesterol/gamma-HCH transport system substrate-binding protein